MVKCSDCGGKPQVKVDVNDVRVRCLNCDKTTSSYDVRDDTIGALLHSGTDQARWEWHRSNLPD